MSANTYTPDAFHIDDEDFFRHWSPESEKYGSGDALIGLLYQGWHVTGVVFREEHWRGTRRVLVYHFKLARGEERKAMAVLQSPGIDRILPKLNVQVVQVNQRKETVAQRW